MKLVVQAVVLLLLGTAFCIAQETKTAEQDSNSKSTLSGFDWLKQFEGNWANVSKAPSADGVATENKSVMESRVVGGYWIVIEQNGLMGETKFESVQTIGYDTKKKQFVGTWIDSVSDFQWSYVGTLDSTGKKLTLEAEGPDWEDSTKTRKYRDTFEFNSANEIASESQALSANGKWETFMTGKMTKVLKAKASEGNKPLITPFLMFIGQAEAAIELYKTVFDDTKIESINKYKANEAGKEGTVQLATVSIAGQRVMCIDSPAVHDFDFTPSFSFFVDCESEEQLKERFTKLADGGKVMMPVDNYGFSKQFGWVSDKFGVSWQLNLK